MTTVRYVGAGSFSPPRVIPNPRITRAIPGWSPERIESRTGIVERRFLWDFDDETGHAIAPAADAEGGPRCNVDMAEVAVRRALEVAGLKPSELDGVVLVTSTPDEINFCRDAVQLHQRLGLRADAHAFGVDSGCGGAVFMIDVVRRMLLSGQGRTIAVVATLFASPYLDREVFTQKLPGRERISAYLSMYMFGDGAGAIILRADEGSDLGIQASVAGTDHPELVIHRGGGALLQPARAKLADAAWFVDGPVVARAYPEYMQRAVDGLRAARPDLVPAIRRHYLHQANKFVLLKFVEQAGIPVDTVPIHVHRYGNTSAASTLILFAEEVAEGRVKLGSGELALFAAVGAGVHYGGQLVKL